VARPQTNFCTKAAKQDEILGSNDTRKQHEYSKHTANLLLVIMAYGFYSAPLTTSTKNKNTTTAKISAKT